MRVITKQEILGELYGLLGMVHGFDSHHVGGHRRDELRKALPHQLAVRIMELQKQIEISELLGDTTLSKEDL